ncbi:ATPase [Pseudomonas alkylphenolica]|uniref:ATPase n=1 Tax=Pseudomonas alkylphenolica TaxID=237609 RepID=A0A443ZSA8_9PSED|nr:ATPase [Pseudomonas alkylphenolica]RWU22272.1 ATPase [Pseudomonas alkylphenolica]
MRNDAQDDFDNVPTLRAVTRDDDDFDPLPAGHGPVKAGARKAPRATSTGPLWALLGASFIALAGLGWWSFQQVSLMEQQLVATQESFARISEDAAGRLQAISGKVDASESNVNTGSEALKLQIKQLQASLAEQGKQQQGVAGQAGDLGKRLEQVLAQANEQQATTARLQTELQAQLKAVNGELAALKAAQVDGGKLDAQISSLTGDVAALKKQGNPSAAIQRLEQDLIVLKSEQENRPATPAASGASVAEFDAFRAQMTRNINTLQSQVQNLQQQINARP